MQSSSVDGLGQGRPMTWAQPTRNGVVGGSNVSSTQAPTFATPVSPVGFWDQSLSCTRKKVFRAYVKTLLILIVVVILILVIYAGVSHEVKDRLQDLTVAVVSFEGLPPFDTVKPLVGPFVQLAVQAEMQSTPNPLGFEFGLPGEYANDPVNLHQAVYEQKFWAAIIVNSNATATLLEAIENNTTYDPQGAMQIVYNQARDTQTCNAYVLPALNKLAASITTSFSQYMMAQSTVTEIAAGIKVSSIPTVGFAMLNLRPFSPPAALPTITIGLVYLTILSFYSYQFFIHIHMLFVLPDQEMPHPPLKFRHWITYRWLATITAYFSLAGAYSLVSLAMGIPFSNVPPQGQNEFPLSSAVTNANPFGRATFIVYCLLNFIGISALGLISENAAMLLSVVSSTPYSSLFNLGWIVANVSTSLYPVQLANEFYRWGYGLPLYQMVEASKTLVLGTDSNLPVNFTILLAWTGIATAIFPISCWLMRWKGIEHKKAAVKQAKKVVNAAETTKRPEPVVHSR